MNHPSTSLTERSSGRRGRPWSRCFIILLAAIAVGLAFNALSPDGIPLVKKKPGMTNS